ncbi:hypothetical protein L195_g046888, partial [Trifolium pratense]
SFQGSPCEDRNFRSDDDTETEDASISRQEDITDLHGILEWAKKLLVSIIVLVALQGDQHLSFRLDDNALYLSCSAVDLKSGNTGLELVE